MDINKKRLIDQTYQDAIQKGFSKAQQKTYIKSAVKDYERRYGSTKDNFLQKVLKSMAHPILKTGKNILGAGYEVGRAGASKLGAEGVYADPETGQTVQNPFLSMSELTKLSADSGASGLGALKDMGVLKQIYEQGVKPSAGLVAYGVPMGKATSVLGKGIPAVTKIGQAAVRGVGTGALAALGQTQETATAGETAANIGIGAAIGGVTSAGMFKLSQVAQNRLMARQTKRGLREEFQAKSWKPSETGTEPYFAQPKSKKLSTDLILEQNPIHKNRYTESLKPAQTVEKLKRYNLWNRDEWAEAGDVFYGQKKGDGVSDFLEVQAMKATKPVNSKGVFAYWDDTVMKYTKAKKIDRLVKDELMDMYMNADDMAKFPEGSQMAFDPNRVIPEKYIASMRNIEQMRYRLLDSGLNKKPTVEETVIAKALGNLHNHMEDQLYNKAGYDAAFTKVLKGVDPVTDKASPELAKVLGDIKIAYPEIYKDIMAARGFAGYRNVMSTLVRGSQLAKASYWTKVSQGTNISRVASGKGIGQFLNPLTALQNLGSTRGVNEAIAKGLNVTGGVSQRMRPVQDAMSRGVVGGLNIGQKLAPIMGGKLTPQALQRFNILQRSKEQPLP